MTKIFFSLTFQAFVIVTILGGWAGSLIAQETDTLTARYEDENSCLFGHDLSRHYIEKPEQAFDVDRDCLANGAYLTANSILSHWETTPTGLDNWEVIKQQNLAAANLWHEMVFAASGDSDMAKQHYFNDEGFSPELNRQIKKFHQDVIATLSEGLLPRDQVKRIKLHPFYMQILIEHLATKPIIPEGLFISTWKKASNYSSIIFMYKQYLDHQARNPEYPYFMADNIPAIERYLQDVLNIFLLFRTNPAENCYSFGMAPGLSHVVFKAFSTTIESLFSEITKKMEKVCPLDHIRAKAIIEAGPGILHQMRSFGGPAPLFKDYLNIKPPSEFELNMISNLSIYERESRPIIVILRSIYEIHQKHPSKKLYQQTSREQ